VTAPPPDPIGWNFVYDGSNKFNVTALGSGQPDTLILGAPDSNGNYPTANASIKGNDPHNPFVEKDAIFTLNIAGVDATSSITAVSFQFGTGNTTVTGTGQFLHTPEPSHYALLLGGLMGAAIIFARRRGWISQS